MAASDLANLPVLSFPPPEIRNQIPEWEEVCISSWTVVCAKFLTLPANLFTSAFESTATSPIVGFLTSYVETISLIDRVPEEHWKLKPDAQQLQRSVFLLIHRIFSQCRVPPEPLLQWSFLGRFCRIYRHQKALSEVIERTWNTHSEILNASLQKYKDVLTTRFESLKSDSMHDDPLRTALIPLIRACPSAGTYLLVGSDFFDSAISAYGKLSEVDRPKILLLSYFMLLAPLQARDANQSLLRDHLFTLRADAEKADNGKSKQHTLLSDLVTETPLYSQLRRQGARSADFSKVVTLVQSLEEFRRPYSSRVKTFRQTKVEKGKNRESALSEEADASNGIHVHRMSKISQIQDLFPNLGSGFVLNLLEEYNDNVEQITMHLLEDTLPANLKHLDRTQNLQTYGSATISAKSTFRLTPRPTPPPTPPHERRNVYDNDEFDRLAVSNTQLYLSRKDTDAAVFEQDESARTSAKAAIMSALAAFDADDDERDDTYDLEDVGGTVDKATGPDGDEDASINALKEKNEEILFAAWKINPASFGRDATTRRSRERQVLRSATTMTDEAIEGWALMLQRDSGRMRRMEAKYATFGGVQLELKPTSWQAKTESDSEGVSSGVDTPRVPRGGRGGQRGRGGTQRPQSNNVAGPSGDMETQLSRDRKGANKSSRANHNRRDQRARKMARGGGMAG